MSSDDPIDPEFVAATETGPVPLSVGLAAEPAPTDDVLVPPEESRLAPDEDRLRAEYEDLLAVAERLQESCDRLQGRIELAGAVNVVVLVLSVLAALYFRFRLNAEILMAAVAPVLVFIVLSAVQTVLMSKTKKRLERDLRALDEIVSLLRETENAFTWQGLGTLGRAQFKIRMARFPLRSAK